MTGDQDPDLRLDGSDRAGTAAALTRERVSTGWRSGPLGVRNFRLLIGGQFASTIGDSCYAVALPWLVLSAHGGPVLLGTVLACYGVPRTVFIPVGGLLADKFGPRIIMLAADFFRCVIVAALAVLSARHVVTLPGLGPIGALMGAGEGLFIPASYSIVPSLLDAKRLTAGNALSVAMAQAGGLLGPALGGALVATAGPVPAFVVDAASFAVSAVTLTLIPHQSASRSVTASVVDERATIDETGRAEELADATCATTGDADAIRRASDAAMDRTARNDGEVGDASSQGVLALLRKSRVLQLLIVATFTANLATGGMGGVALPSLAHARYGADGYGALLACSAGGIIIGTVAAARSASLRRPAIVASVVFLFMAAAISVVPFLGGLPGAAAALIVFGACSGLGNVIIITKLQMWAPPSLLGRLTGVLLVCVMGTFPLSVAVTGLLVRHIGPSPVFPIAGVPIALIILFGLTQREWRDFGTPAKSLEQRGPGDRGIVTASR